MISYLDNYASPLYFKGECIGLTLSILSNPGFSNTIQQTKVKLI